jgi:hypothetical protein
MIVGVPAGGYVFFGAPPFSTDPLIAVVIGVGPVEAPLRYVALA